MLPVILTIAKMADSRHEMSGGTIPSENETTVTQEEKRILSTNISKLPSEKLNSVLQIIAESMPSRGEEEIEINIGALDTQTLRRLQKFVNGGKTKSLNNKFHKSDSPMSTSHIGVDEMAAGSSRQHASSSRQHASSPSSKSKKRDRSESGDSDSVRWSSTRGPRDPLSVRQTNIIERIMKEDEKISKSYGSDAALFLVPPTEEIAPGYNLKIAEEDKRGCQMILENIREGKYISNEDMFIKDVNLMWTNAVKYNGEFSNVAKIAFELKDIFKLEYIDRTEDPALKRKKTETESMETEKLNKIIKTQNERLKTQSNMIVCIHSMVEAHRKETNQIMYEQQKKLDEQQKKLDQQNKKLEELHQKMKNLRETNARIRSDLGKHKLKYIPKIIQEIYQNQVVWNRFGPIFNKCIRKETANLFSQIYSTDILLDLLQPSNSSSTSAADSASTSASDSVNTSAADSVSTSAADSASTSAADSVNTSAADSVNTSAADSANTSAAHSASTSAADSVNTSTADSASTSAADSVNTSAGDSASTSAADSASTSPADSVNTSAVDSASTSAADSASTSAADSVNTSAADSVNTSAADSANTSAAHSASTSAADSVNTSTADSASTSAADSVNTSAGDSASTSANTLASGSSSVGSLSVDSTIPSVRDSASNSGSDSTIVSNNNSIGSLTNDSNNGSGSASIGNSDDDKYDTPQQYIYPRWILLNNVKFLKDLIKDSLLGSFDKLWTEKITTANGTKTLGPQLIGTLINTPDFKSQFCNKLILKIPHSIINQLVQVQIKNIVTPAYLHMQSQSKIPKIIREHVDEKFISEFLEKNKLNLCEKIKEKFMTSHFTRSKIQEICSDRIGAAIADHVRDRFAQVL